MVNVTHYVIETYSDGGTWTHSFNSLHLAQNAKALMSKWHPARSYEIKEAN